MAKDGTLDHPKTLMLAGELGIDPPFALGILEALWGFTRKYAPAGDIGKFSDAAIALGIRTSIKPDKLIEALLLAGFIDESEDHRLVIHDWADHITKHTEREVKKRGIPFATGKDERRNTGGRPPSSGRGEAEQTAIRELQTPPVTVTEKVQITANAELTTANDNCKQEEKLQTVSANAFPIRATPNQTKRHHTKPPPNPSPKKQEENYKPRSAPKTDLVLASQTFSGDPPVVGSLALKPEPVRLLNRLLEPDNSRCKRHDEITFADVGLPPVDEIAAAKRQRQMGKTIAEIFAERLAKCQNRVLEQNSKADL